MKDRKLASTWTVLLLLSSACSVREAPAGQTMARAPAADCTDSMILTRTAADESVRAELAHLRAHYRDVDGEPTAKVNVRLAAGASVDALAPARSATAVVPVPGLEHWYGLTFADTESAIATVRPLLCDRAVERAELDIKRRYVRRSTR